MKRIITSQRQLAEALKRRVKQQAAVTELGLQALRGLEKGALLDSAVNTISQILDCPMVKVLELLPDTSKFIVQAGVGWRDGIVGQALVPNQIDTQAGFTLQQSSPVVVKDLSSELRFTSPHLLSSHGVKSGISVVI